MISILNIDTAVESASVSLACDGTLAAFRANENIREHSGWIHNAIRDVMKQGGISLNQLSAIAVTNGPGSYTGLRIGLTTAKGLCYALNLPLITIGTLDVMARAAINQASEDLLKDADLLCPMIDARRMEVYTAVYDKKLKTILPAQAMILDTDSFHDLLDKNRIIFTGNGSPKMRSVITHPHAIIAEFVNSSAIDMAGLSLDYYKQKIFADLPYAEPLYLKEFYTHSPR